MGLNYFQERFAAYFENRPPDPPPPAAKRPKPSVNVTLPARMAGKAPRPILTATGRQGRSEPHAEAVRFGRLAEYLRGRGIDATLAMRTGGDGQQHHDLVVPEGQRAAASAILLDAAHIERRKR